MNVRMSTYNIYLDTDARGRTRILNGLTGESLRVENRLLGVISKNGPAPLPEHLLGDPRITVLLKAGIITDARDDEEVAFFRRQVHNMHADLLRNTPAYTFILGMECNFNCVYCYQRMEIPSGPTGGAFTTEMADAFFRSLPMLEAGLRVPKNNLRGYAFIGGEPFLAANKPVIENIIKRAGEVGAAAFSAVSNAYCLHHYAEILGPEGISSIQVTVDGPAEVHDRRRPTRGGSGTFATIADNIDLALSLGVKISLRVNVDRHNIVSLPALAREIVARSWHDNNLFGAYLGLVHGAFVQDRVLTTSMILDFLESRHADCSELAIFSISEVDSIRALRQMVESGMSAITAFKPTYCYAHNSNVMVDPDGRIYTCLETDLSDDYLIGRIDPRGKLTWSMAGRRRWQGRSVANIAPCMRCGYALYCGGGCVVRAREKNGDMYSPCCQDFRELFHRVFSASATSGPYGYEIRCATSPPVKATLKKRPQYHVIGI
jgi:uncharacterized protein